MIKKADKIAYRQKNKKDLLSRLLEIQKELVEVKIKVTLGQEKKHTQIKKLKHEISFIKTVLKEKSNETDEQKN